MVKRCILSDLYIWLEDLNEGKVDIISSYPGRPPIQMCFSTIAKDNICTDKFLTPATPWFGLTH